VRECIYKEKGRGPGKEYQFSVRLFPGTMSHRTSTEITKKKKMGRETGETKRKGNRKISVRQVSLALEGGNVEKKIPQEDEGGEHDSLKKKKSRWVRVLQRRVTGGERGRQERKGGSES